MDESQGASRNRREGEPPGSPLEVPPGEYRARGVEQKENLLMNDALIVTPEGVIVRAHPACVPDDAWVVIVVGSPDAAQLMTAEWHCVRDHPSCHPDLLGLAAAQYIDAVLPSWIWPGERPATHPDHGG